jgi:hypothetical protein
MWKEMPVSRVFSANLPGSPVMKSPLQVPLTKHPWKERCSISRAPFYYLSEFPVNGTAMILKNGATM